MAQSLGHCDYFKLFLLLIVLTYKVPCLLARSGALGLSIAAPVVPMSVAFIRLFVSELCFRSGHWGDFH